MSDADSCGDCGCFGDSGDCCGDTGGCDATTVGGGGCDDSVPYMDTSCMETIFSEGADILIDAYQPVPLSSRKQTQETDSSERIIVYILIASVSLTTMLISKLIIYIYVLKFKQATDLRLKF